jgi:GntR family transcriptional regulator
VTLDFDRSARGLRLRLRSAVRSGRWAPGDALSETAVVSASGASRTAVREALDDLAACGLVRRVRGRGTTVTTAIIVVPVDDLRPTDNGVTIERRTVGVVPSPPQVRRALTSDAGTVGFVEDLFLVDGVPIGLRVAYHDPAGVQRPRAGECPHLATAFLETFGVELGEVECAVEAGRADDRTARLLGVPPGGVLLTKEQRLRDVEGRVREIAYGQYRADRVSFTAHR